MLLLNSFYILVTLSFENYLGLILPDILFNRTEPAASEKDYDWDSNSFIYGFLLESWFYDLFSDERLDYLLMLDICVCMCSSLLLFMENLGRDSPFDKKSKPAVYSLEKIIIEIRDVSFKIITMLFAKVEIFHSQITTLTPSFVSKSIYCLKMVNQLLEYSATSQSEKNKHLFKPNLIHFINDTSIPLYLKKDILLFYLRTYSDAADLKEVNFASIFAQVQQ